MKTPVKAVKKNIKIGDSLIHPVHGSAVVKEVRDKDVIVLFDRLIPAITWIVLADLNASVSALIIPNQYIQNFKHIAA